MQCNIGDICCFCLSRVFAMMEDSHDNSTASSPRVVPLKEVTKAEDQLLYNTLYANNREKNSIQQLREELTKAVTKDREVFYKSISAPAKKKLQDCQALSAVLAQEENQHVLSALLFWSALMFTVPVAVLLIVMRVAGQYGGNTALWGGLSAVGSTILIAAGYVVHAFYEEDADTKPRPPKEKTD